MARSKPEEDEDEEGRDEGGGDKKRDMRMYLKRVSEEQAKDAGELHDSEPQRTFVHRFFLNKYDLEDGQRDDE